MKTTVKLTRLFAAWAIALFTVQTSIAQDTIIFTQGLMTSGGRPMDRSAFTTDRIAYSFIEGTMGRPVEGAKVFSTPEDTPPANSPKDQAVPVPAENERHQGHEREQNEAESKWVKVTPGDNGYFTGKDMRGGGLYLEYDSPKSRTMLLEVYGNTISIVNGIPLEGDLYNFGYSIRPVTIRKGLNSIYLTFGRFPGIKAMLIDPDKHVLLTAKDLTLPDLIVEEQIMRFGAVQVINATEKEMKGYSLRCEVNGVSETTPLPVLAQENTRKLPFRIPVQGEISGNEATARLILISPSGKEMDRIQISLKNKHFSETHDRTFISSIDGSVQYFSVTPGGRREPGEALFLSVHGAGVEARGQARAYKPKDWGDLVAATNRRPYGFNWEDWGRIDALEVLEEAKKLFNPDPSRIYLTGHSMGGHGTWYLGAVYPSLFAAIAPSAGYADLLNYASRPGTSSQSPAGAMMLRAGNTSRTVSLARNYLHYGIYVFHGDADETVPVQQAREMRKLLGAFHPDFAYYEYLGGHHWISDESVDWPPIFEFFRRHTIPSDQSVLKIEFCTANPGVSANSHWLTIVQQTKPLLFSTATVSIDTATKTISGTTGNISLLSINASKVNISFPVKIILDSIEINCDKADQQGIIWLQNTDSIWHVGSAPPAGMKNPLRNGPFKDAFRNNMVFVYGTGGTAAENEWMYARARYDASTFGYRGNGSIEIISDKEFIPSAFSERNIILYGNINTNKAWNKVLINCPVEAGNGYIKVGEKRLTGDDLACFFVYPRMGSDKASVGVIGGSGMKGIKGAYSNQYLNSGSGFPDLTIVGADAASKGYDAVICTGFFGNDWKVESGEFFWK